jgi:ABC-type nitrate/sulfonate/bicarbonate transport system permease component
MRVGRLRWLLQPGLLPIIVVIAAWLLLPQFLSIPTYQFPSLGQVLQNLWTLTVDGTLPGALAASLIRLVIAFAIGAALGVIVGLGITLSERLRTFLLPLIAFFNSIAGIAWIPMAIAWFGFGNGPVLFVIANNIFFVVVYNTILGARSIPSVLFDGVRVLGGVRRFVLVREVLLPGAMVGVLGGLRTGLAFGWRALIAVELIAASSGLGYMSIEASRLYDGATVVAVILVIGVVWLVMDRFFLRPLEARTVVRWGMMAGASTGSTR